MTRVLMEAGCLQCCCVGGGGDIQKAYKVVVMFLPVMHRMSQQTRRTTLGAPDRSTQILPPNVLCSFVKYEGIT